MSLRIAVAIGLGLLGAGTVVADDVVLTNGKAFEGVDVRIVGEIAIIDLGFGRLRLPRARIAEVIETDVGAADYVPRRPTGRSASASSPSPPPEAEPWRQVTEVLAEALERRDDQIDTTLEIIQSQIPRRDEPFVIVPPSPLVAIGPGFFDGRGPSGPGESELDARRLAPLPIFGIAPATSALGSGGSATWSQVARRQPGSLIPAGRF